MNLTLMLFLLHQQYVKIQIASTIFFPVDFSIAVAISPPQIMINITSTVLIKHMNSIDVNPNYTHMTYIDKGSHHILKS